MAGKIVFAAPSRPLVLQQIEACHNIGGIPQVRKLFHLTPQSGILKRQHFLCLLLSYFEEFVIVIELFAGMGN